MSQTILEKLEIKNEKNILIQGLPSSIEKQFCKLSFAKNLTPLLKTRKIDFALVFAVNENQLNGILDDIMPALKEESKLWVAYPKATSKIATDLNREGSWNKLVANDWNGNDPVSLDHVWHAVSFSKSSVITEVDIVEEETPVVVKRKTTKLVSA